MDYPMYDRFEAMCTIIFLGHHPLVMAELIEEEGGRDCFCYGIDAEAAAISLWMSMTYDEKDLMLYNLDEIEKGNFMDIGSGNGYPSAALSNFAVHPFVFDDVPCAGMEGLLQAFKSSNPAVQAEVCKLTGFTAKKAGKHKNWQERQILYWKGVEYKRDSTEYQLLLDRAFDALATNEGFQKALLASNNAVLKHSIGRTKKNETVLTRAEFCKRLTAIRTRLQRGIQ
jgi:hypothetical protein